MKNTYKFFLAAVAWLVFATTANAQATASASSTATIVTPISITKNVDMNFGNIAVQAGTGGTVALAASAAATRVTGGAGGVTLPVVTGTVTAAQFTVNGTANYLYHITLPADNTITLVNGGNLMHADLFNNSVAGTLDNTGTQSFYVGATLTVAAAQASGVYTTATPFNVTVNYN